MSTNCNRRSEQDWSEFFEEHVELGLKKTALPTSFTIKRRFPTLPCTFECFVCSDTPTSSADWLKHSNVQDRKFSRISVWNLCYHVGTCMIICTGPLICDLQNANMVQVLNRTLILMHCSLSWTIPVCSKQYCNAWTLYCVGLLGRTECFKRVSRVVRELVSLCLTGRGVTPVWAIGILKQAQKHSCLNHNDFGFVSASKSFQNVCQRGVSSQPGFISTTSQIQ